ncbi:MAG: DUF1501 domain-containing protein [Planctomycetota bacterium]|nr:DUF1501 domain-containing protein [Planctomycetota bacterium]
MNQLPSDDSRVSPQEFPHVALSRRLFLGGSVLGLGSIAAACLSERESHGDTAPAVTMAPARLPKATAKRVILIFAAGGLSQLDLFDEKPLLNQRRGEELPPSIRKGQRISGVTEAQGALPVVGSAFQFKSFGKSGLRLSELFREMGGFADDLCVVRSMQTDHVLHEAAMSILYTGSLQLGRPSWGSWVSYALGSENQDLPEFVVMLSGTRDGGSPPHPRMWHNGYLPGRYQGCTFRGGSEPVFFVKNPKGVTDGARKSVLERLAELNGLESARSGDPYVATRIQNYEMAARMQTSVPELTDLSKEPADVLAQYGAEPGKESFANNCLLARRLAERGVRFIQLMDGGWDHHYNIPVSLKEKMAGADKPIAALLRDLKERGLLAETLVIFCGEFGRTSYCEGPMSFASYGRDHQQLSGGLLLAGGGIRGGTSYGETDEWGWDVVKDPAHVHDIQATVLHALGLDHKQLVTRYQGRDFRLTDVGGNVLHPLLA